MNKDTFSEIPEEKLQEEIEQQQTKIVNFLMEDPQSDVVNIMAMQNIIIALLLENEELNIEEALEMVKALFAYARITISMRAADSESKP
jgi:hypothetical protein